MSSNREYDDDKKPSDGHDDEADINSRGAGSSYHLNCSSNFFSGRSTSSQFDDVELKGCDKNQMNDLYYQQHLNELQIFKLAKFHMKCDKDNFCPLQVLKRRICHFIFNPKVRNTSSKY